MRSRRRRRVWWAVSLSTSNMLSQVGSVIWAGWMKASPTSKARSAVHYTRDSSAIASFPHPHSYRLLLYFCPSHTQEQGSSQQEEAGCCPVRLSIVLWLPYGAGLIF